MEQLFEVFAHVKNIVGTVQIGFHHDLGRYVVSEPCSSIVAHTKEFLLAKFGLDCVSSCDDGLLTTNVNLSKLDFAFTLRR